MSKPKKAPKVKPATASSVFGGVRNSSVALPGFGTGTTTISGDGNNKSISTSFNPDAQISSIMGKAKQGIEDNQSIFNLTPEQQFAQIESNPYYQYQKMQNSSFLKQGQADARQSAAASGLENSTIAGAIEASLLKDAAEMDLQARLGANDYSRAIAGQNLGVNQDLLDQFYGYMVDPASLSNQTLMNAGNSQDQVGMFNAGQIQNANAFNAQMQFQQDQLNRQRGLGAALGYSAGFFGGPLLGGTIAGAFGQSDNALKGHAAMTNLATSLIGMGMGNGGNGGFVKR